MKKQLILEHYNNSLFEQATSQVGVPEGMMRVKGTIGKAGVKNRNNRIYSAQNYKKHIALLQEMIPDGLYGELEHPKGFTIDNNNVSHKIEEIWFDDDTQEVKGTFLLLDTPKGKIAQSIVRSGGKLRVSTRATGTVDDKDNAIIEELVTVDIVGTPGFKEAAMTMSESFKLLYEDASCSVYFKDCEVSLHENKTKVNTNKQINQNSNIMDEKRILALIEQVFEKKLAPALQDWLTESFEPAMQRRIMQKFAPAIQSWIVEEYSPEVQKWIIEQYSPEVQKWIIEEFSPVVQKWVLEEYSPEVQKWSVNELGSTIIEFVKKKGNKLNGLSESQIKSQFGAYVNSLMEADNTINSRRRRRLHEQEEEEKITASECKAEESEIKSDEEELTEKRKKLREMKCKLREQEEPSEEKQKEIEEQEEEIKDEEEKLEERKKKLREMKKKLREQEEDEKGETGEKEETLAEKFRKRYNKRLRESEENDEMTPEEIEEQEEEIEKDEEELTEKRKKLREMKKKLRESDEPSDEEEKELEEQEEEIEKDEEELTEKRKKLREMKKNLREQDDDDDNDDDDDDNDDEVNESRSKKIIKSHMDLVESIKNKINETKKLPKTQVGQSLNEDYNKKFVELIPEDYKNVWKSMNETQKAKVLMISKNRNIKTLSESRKFWDKLDIQDLMKINKPLKEQQQKSSGFGAALRSMTERLNY